MCTAHNSWKAQDKLPLIETIISVPHIVTDYGQEWYQEEITRGKEKIEAHFGVSITEDRLREAISLCNETRQLQARLSDFRRKGDPPITGSESLSVLVSEGSMPKTDYNRLLTALLEALETENGVPGFSHRLMIAGSVIDDPDILAAIEDMGGIIVADTLCFGERRMSRSVTEDRGDPLSAVAEQYYRQIMCPRMFDSYPERFQASMDIATEARVDGVVLQSIKNCDLHGIDNVMLERDFEKAGLPVLVMEREYDALADAGRIKTRVQAFLERIGRRSNE